MEISLIWDQISHCNQILRNYSLLIFGIVSKRDYPQLYAKAVKIPLPFCTCETKFASYISTKM